MSGDKRTRSISAVLAIVVMMSMSILVYFLFGPEPVHEINRKSLIESLEGRVGASISISSLKEVTPFEWDTFYVFGPYIPEEEIRKVVGDKSFPYMSGVNDGLLPIYFVKDGKVVCDIYGYPENIGIRFKFPPFEGAYKKLSAGQDGPWRIYSDDKAHWVVDWEYNE